MLIRKRPKRKRNLTPRGINEVVKSHVRVEQPTGKFVDLFKRMEDKGFNNLSNVSKPSKSDDASE